MAATDMNNPNFEVLESQLSETEMALMIAVSIAFNHALLTGANAHLMISNLDQHEQNFKALGQKKAAHMFAGLKALVANTAGIK